MNEEYSDYLNQQDLNQKVSNKEESSKSSIDLYQNEFNIEKKFTCHICNFGCNRITHWNNHLNTKKHINNERKILDTTKNMDQLLFKIQNETIRSLSTKIEQIIQKDKNT